MKILLVVSFVCCVLSICIFGQPIIVRNTGISIDGVEERFLVSNEGKVIRPLKDGESINFSEGIGVLTYRKDVKVYPADYFGRHDQNIFSMLLTETGTRIVPTDFQAEVGKFSDGWAIINYEPMMVYSPDYEASQIGYIDKTGKVVLKPTAGISGDFVNGVTFKKDVTSKKYGLINKTGSWVLKPTYDEILDFSDGVARVKRKNANIEAYYGYIDTAGKIVIPTEIVQSEEECGNFVGGFAICSDYQHTKSYFIDKKRKVISKKYDAVGVFSEGIAMVANHNSDGILEWSAIDATGKEVFAKKVFTTLKDDEIYPNSMVFKNGLFPTSEGYINTKGELALKFPEFNIMAAYTFDHGFATVLLSPKRDPKQITYRFTLINTAGKILWQSIENEKPE